MIGLIVILVTIVVFMIIVVFLGISSRKKDRKRLLDSLETQGEVFYEIGYKDQKSGNVKYSWKSLDGGRGKFFEAIIKVFQSFYDQGWQDAFDGKPNIAEEIAKNRQEQIRILGEMKRNLEGTLETLGKSK